MSYKKWSLWWLILILLLVLGQAIAYFILLQGISQGKVTSVLMVRIGGVTSISMFVVAYIWLAIGLFVARKTPWVWWAGFIIHATTILYVLTYLLQYLGFPRLAISTFGLWCMAAVALVGVFLVRLILSPSTPITGVARTVVDEAIRMGVVLVPIVTLMALVCILPVILNPTELLEYRVQTFLSWSVSSTAFLLSLMTVFLAVTTVCDEIKNKQIYLTLTKPVSRFQYLLGKWLGITLLNIVLVIVSGLGIYEFTQMIATRTFAQSYEDEINVSQRVLVAREAQEPVPIQGSLAPLVNAQLEKLRASDPNTYGPNMTQEDLAKVQTNVIQQWLNISYGSSTTYRFKDLQSARKYTDFVQMLIKVDASPRPPDEIIRMEMTVNGRPYRADYGPSGESPVYCNQIHTIDIPVSLIGPDGILDVNFKNMTIGHNGNNNTVGPVSIAFTKGKMEILYRVASFEDNLVKALFMVWFRLMFLAMVGLMAATFLGFPVACMLSLMVFIVSTCSGFMSESLNNYVALAPDSAFTGNPIFAPIWAMQEHLFIKPDFYKALKVIVRLWGQLFLFIVPSFSDFDPVPPLVDGRKIPDGMVTNCFLYMGLGWTAISLLIAWLIFRTKELARVIV